MFNSQGSQVASSSANYIEDVFSTYLYTGNATTGQSINNGIDLATKGGLLWCKNRTTASTPHYLFDTSRDFSYTYASSLNTASTAAETGQGTDYAKPETNGFSFGSGAGTTSPNKNGDAFVSWTFRKQPKFFDVVTYTGTGTNTAVPHNLGSTPGCVIVKATGVSGDWGVWHRGTGAANAAILGISLNTTNGAASTTGSQSYATSTTFDYQGVYDYTGSTALNVSGRQYVAYLFAHDAGGFGLTGTDNVISCGSFTTDGSGVASVTLGYEPQFLLQKPTLTTGNWFIADNMRGMPVGANATLLRPNLSDAESAGGVMSPTATGFSVSGFQVSQTYIYIAIRRGPMKVPTSGTSVFMPSTASTGTLINTGFPVDLWIGGSSSGDGGTSAQITVDRLRGPYYLGTSSTVAQIGTNNSLTVAPTNTFTNITQGGTTRAEWLFGRAPGFMDIVCYVGNGAVNRSIAHNLGVIPEFYITRAMSGPSVFKWGVYSSYTGLTQVFQLSKTDAATADNWWGTNPLTTTSFSVSGNDPAANTSTGLYVAYLFATCPGVSKVGSYTGTGALQTVNCGFTTGARYIIIKRSDSAGDWYVYDSARGISSGTDPYMFLNSSAAQVTGTNYVDTTSVGFQVTAAASGTVNVSGGTYIFLAIA